MIAAGFDNGDVNMFDLRNMKLQWSTNVGNGVCSLQYDRMGNYIYKRLSSYSIVLYFCMSDLNRSFDLRYSNE